MIRLLPRDALLKTSDVDEAVWNYRFFLGLIQRMRFKLVVSLLSSNRFHRLLEIGYGSGVFMPELSRHCEELFGIDPHQKQDLVTQVLKSHQVVAKLFSGSASAMPFQSGHFDCIVAVSALEYVEDLEAACAEIKRVLNPGGTLIAVTPGHSPVVDLGLRILTGKSARQDYGNRRERLVPVLLRQFPSHRIRKVPIWGGPVFCLYTALKLGVQ